MKVTLTTAAMALVILCVLAGCGGDKDGASSDASKAEEMINGTWVRPIRGQDNRLEGMRFDDDHFFGLLGIHSMHGLQWRVVADTLVVTTNTGRYPEPQESRLVIEVVDETTLTLAGKNYLAGTYTRDDEAGGHITGSVSYPQKIALPPEAVVYLTLKSTVGGFLAAHAIPVLGGQVPIPFQICYLASSVVPGHTYKLEVLIVADGKRLFHAPDGVSVITQGNPVDIEVRMTPFSGDNAGIQEFAGEKPQTYWLSGMFTYMADAGLFTECRTGERFPVAQKADNIALERAYLSERAEPGQPLYVTIDGHLSLEPAMEGDGEREAIIVNKFLSVSATAECPDGSVTTLENTHWELVGIDGEPVAMTADKKRAHLRVNVENGRVVGFAGCNSFFGSFTLEGPSLKFSGVGATMKACLDGMEFERAYLSALDSTTGYDLTGDTLTFKAGERNLATFEARYFK